MKKKNVCWEGEAGGGGGWSHRKKSHRKKSHIWVEKKVTGKKK